MGLSLRDQLIRAGLATEKQARQASAPARAPQLPKSQRGQPTASERAMQQSLAEKAARDAALNRKQQEKAERKARRAEIRQLVQQHVIARPESEEYYNFVDGAKIKRIAINTPLREQLRRGDVVIVCCDNRYELVPPAIAERIRERDASAVMAASLAGSTAATEATADDPYREHVVPDDLMW
jgi:uncharacterized protein YaiL (DUF2058 family)